MTASMLANHLWQSSIVAIAAWLITMALRRNRAGTRYGVWLAASLKFLVPFTLLVSAGSQLDWRSATISQPPQTMFVMEVITQPFSVATGASASVAPAARAFAIGDATQIWLGALLAIWLAGVVVIVIMWSVRWRRVSAIVNAGMRVDSGPVYDALRRVEAQSGVETPLAVVVSDTSLEPGVFGIVTPVLLWPRQISEHLAEAQIDAIVAHEIAHVRRRDNLAAAAHMIVQATFWFHPMVWWVGARLVDERERACDEEVVRLGGDPRAYAESILKTCQFFVESPLACVTGVTGSDLKKRIEHIMVNDQRATLNVWRKALLAVAAAAAILGPVVVGVLNAPRLRAQSAAVVTMKRIELAVGGLEQVRLRAQAAVAAGPRPAFDVTSVKPNNSGDGRIMMLPAAGRGWSGTNVTLGMLIRIAFQLQNDQIVGGPKWLFSDRFDVAGTGTAPGADGPFWLKLQALLTDRFRLVTHTETRELPIFALALARQDGQLGPKLTRSTADCTPLPGARGEPPAPRPMPTFAPGERPQCGWMGGRGNVIAGGLSMKELATNLSRIIGGLVVDRTGLTGNFDWTLDFAPDPNFAGRGDLPPLPPGAVPDRPPLEGPSIFAALQEQLGLKLESTKGPVDVLVIDSAEKPTAD
jgi:uncharacterized protein (TIGR03435 family)